jgi:hypothetical protein
MRDTYGPEDVPGRENILSCVAACLLVEFRILSCKEGVNHDLCIANFDKCDFLEKITNSLKM